MSGEPCIVPPSVRCPLAYYVRARAPHLTWAECYAVAIRAAVVEIKPGMSNIKWIEASRAYLRQCLPPLHTVQPTQSTETAI